MLSFLYQSLESNLESHFQSFLSLFQYSFLFNKQINFLQCFQLLYFKYRHFLENTNNSSMKRIKCRIFLRVLFTKIFLFLSHSFPIFFFIQSIVFFNILSFFFKKHRGFQKTLIILLLKGSNVEFSLDLFLQSYFQSFLILFQYSSLS